MSLLVLGINHTSAPIEVREKLAFLERDLPRALSALSSLPHVREGALLSTCNRTEAYAVAGPDAGPLENALAEFLAGWHGLSRHEFDGHLYCYRAGAAASHLFSVSSGLDSMILGEPDIQRQVKTALEAAQSANSLGARLNRLFQDALVTGKRTRTETGIARGTFSVGAAAVELATQIFGESLAGHTVLVLGAGKMSEVTARHLLSRGAPAVIVANRTFEKAEALAAQFGGSARRFDDLPALLAAADIVVCSTAAPHPIVSRELVHSVMRARRGRPLYLIDIAVPRDVEPSVDTLENVYLYNIDHLQELVAGARHTRSGEVTRAREIVEESTAEYLRWERSLEVAPLVVAVRQKLDTARHAELERLKSRLPDLPEKDWRVIAAAMQSLTNKIAHPVLVAIKSAPDAEDGAATLETVRQVFGVEENSPPAPNNGGAEEEPVGALLAAPSALALTPPLLGAGGRP